MAGNDLRGSFPRYSAKLVDPVESTHHALYTFETFEIDCLRLDSTFTAWVNATWPTMTPHFDGTLPGSLGGGNPYKWKFISDQINIDALFGAGVFAADQFALRITDLTYSGALTPPVSYNHFLPDNTLGIFGGYSVWGGASDADGPITRHTGPTTVSILPCDLDNPPPKLTFFTNFDAPGPILFGTPDGPIAAPLSYLYLHDAHPPYIWTRKLNSNIYRIEYKVTIEDSDSWVLLGICKDGDEMTFAEFDLLDVPSIPPSPVGIYERGNAHDLNHLAAGFEVKGFPVGAAVGNVSYAYIADAGTGGYQVGDVVTIAGGTSVSPATFSITSIDATGKPRAVLLSSPGNYSVEPPTPNTPTGGHGSGLKLNLWFSVPDVLSVLGSTG